MADEQHIEILRQGADAWNQWRRENPKIRPDLSNTDLSLNKLRQWEVFAIKHQSPDLATLAGLTQDEGFTFRGYDLRGANLRRSNFTSQVFHNADLRNSDLTEAEFAEAVFIGTDMRGADLSGAGMSRANFSLAKLNKARLHKVNLAGAVLLRTDFTQADFTEAYLAGANFTNAHLNGANLSGANLITAILVKTDLSGANLNNCRVYGMSAWDVKMDGAQQTGLIVTEEGEPDITVDNLKVAQFIYLLLSNTEIRDVIDTVGRKAVLILGRFTPERKAVLDAIREELRKRDYLPIMFDFEKPSEKNYIETVSILAKMSRFVIADVTDAKVIMEELKTVVPDNPSVPVRAIAQAGESVNVMINDFAAYTNFVDPMFFYRDTAQVIAELHDNIIAPAERNAAEIADRYRRFEDQTKASKRK